MAMRTHRNLLGAEGQLLLACPVAAQNAVQNHVLQTPFNSPNARIGFRGQQLLPAKTTISRQWLGRSSAFVYHSKPVLSNRQFGRGVARSMGVADEAENPEGTQQMSTLEISIKKWEDILKHSNAYLPHAVVASTVLALVYPPSFAWFTTKYYAPALGFLMFAVGLNFSLKDFGKAFEQPGVLAIGFFCQYMVKPLLGVVFAAISVSILHLPEAVGSGLILVACSSGAQLSNYATFLAEPGFAPLSIVMTALSTAAAVVVTPLLVLLLLGRRLHIDLVGMIRNITEIVVAPIAAGLFLNRFAPSISRMIRPSLPFLSVLVTSCCIGSPLAVNIDSIRSPLGLLILAPVVGFHTAAFVAGYKLTELTWPNTPDLRGLARTMSFETGMQSSLLGLALANNFFEDPLVGLPPAVSVVTMSLMAFGLVTYWNSKQ